MNTDTATYTAECAWCGELGLLDTRTQTGDMTDADSSGDRYHLDGCADAWVAESARQEAKTYR